MLKWLKRRAKEEEPTYCGFIVMQSEWYKKQVEDFVQNIPLEQLYQLWILKVIQK